MKSSTIRGLILLTAAVLSVSLMGVFVRTIGDELPETMILFSRFFMSFLVILPMVFKDKSFSLKVKKPHLIIMRSLFGVVGMGCVFYSIKEISLVSGILFVNTSPIFVPLILFLFLKIKTNFKVIIGIIIGFIGLSIIIKPDAGVLQLNSLIGVCAGILVAAALVSLKRFIMENKQKTNEALFYYFLIASVILFCAMLFNFEQPGIHEIVLLLAVGGFGTSYQIFMTRSMKYLSVKVISPLLYTSVIFSGFFGWLFWNHVPDNWSLFGMCLTIVGAIIVVVYNQEKVVKKKETS